MSTRRPSMEQTMAALRRMTPAQLRQKYLEVFGEPSRTGNKDFLFKRVAWRPAADYPPTVTVVKFCVPSFQL